MPFPLSFPCPALLTHKCMGTCAQYLVGEWDFHCLSNLLVRPPVLIPRPETEVRYSLLPMRGPKG